MKKRTNPFLLTAGVLALSMTQACSGSDDAGGDGDVEEMSDDVVTVDGGTTDGGTDAGTTDPGTSDPGTSDPGTSDPGTSNPGTSDPGTSDPGTSDPGTTDPVTFPANTTFLIDDVTITGCTAPAGFPAGFDSDESGWATTGDPDATAATVGFVADQGVSGGALQVSIPLAAAGDYGGVSLNLGAGDFDLDGCTVSAQVRLMEGPSCGAESLAFTWHNTNVTVPDVGSTGGNEIGAEFTEISFGPVEGFTLADNLNINVYGCAK